MTDDNGNATDSASTHMPSSGATDAPRRRPRGRPRKYNTEDEKAVAHTLAQQGYYQRSVPKPATLDEWKAGIEKNRARLTRCLNNEPAIKLAATVYAQASEEHVTDPCAVILEALEPFNRLHNRVTVIVTGIYRRMGCTDLWKDAEQLGRDVQDVVDLLQDLLCSALSGVSELRAAFTQGLLAYQLA
ncbi:hypothetical protein EV421DRAFT_1912918 [Armillaria borealis]|uniref:Uncharacterized protein n=1 Tax=Armillaria borealis TaxID=47425 RepID=A0AA39MD42_9AGAR|nr:hypothetical protein EV421DRAFT_1912918 [Armillaria borealis]